MSTFIPAAPAFEILELRRYVTNPGTRATLAALFDQEFVETQEACGMVPIGQFLNLDDPNSFVWFRGFPKFKMRAAALEAFYLQSPTWRSLRSTANATLADNDNVLLLREVDSGSGFDLGGLARPDAGMKPHSAHVVGTVVWMIKQAASAAFIDTFEREMLPALRSGAQRVAFFVTHPGPNEFPGLPVRENEFAFVVTGIGEHEESLDRWIAHFARDHVPASLQSEIVSEEILRLAPTPRSLYGS